MGLGPDDPGLTHLQGTQSPSPGSDPNTLGSLVDRYMAVHKANLRPRTQEGYQHILNKWISQLGKHTTLSSITADSIRIIMAKMCDERSPSTANAALRVLKVVLNYAVAEGYLNSLPHKRVAKLPTQSRSPIWWSNDDAAKVLAAAQADTECPRDAHLLFSLALYLGIRKGEIDRLRWEDVKLESDTAVCFIRSTSIDPTKNGKSRYIPICKELRAILALYRQLSGYVVRPENVKGKWTYRFECDAMFNRIVKAAGVPKIRFHDMRHTFASLLLESSATMFKVSRWLGHSDVRITQDTYAHLVSCS